MVTWHDELGLDPEVYRWLQQRLQSDGWQFRLIPGMEREDWNPYHLAVLPSKRQVQLLCNARSLPAELEIAGPVVELGFGQELRFPDNWITARRQRDHQGERVLFDCRLTLEDLPELVVWSCSLADSRIMRQQVTTDAEAERSAAGCLEQFRQWQAFRCLV